jgi:hypothetical protein
VKESGTLDTKFILANNTTQIDYDWGITNILNSHMAPDITMNIEDPDTTIT